MARKLAIVVLFAALASVAAARESTEIIGARYLGMGGAFVAVARDHSLLFANPAALDRVEGGDFATMSTRATVNPKTFDVAGFLIDRREDFEDVGDMEEDEQDKFFDDITDEINFKRMKTSVSFLPFGYLKKGIGGALFTDSDMMAMAYNGVGATPLVEADLRQDVGGVVGAGYGWTGLSPYLANRLSVGASLKYIRRYRYASSQTVTSLADSSEFGFLGGNSVGVDLGLLYDINEKVSVGVGVYDILASDFTWSGENPTFSSILSGEKEDVEPSMRLGVSYAVPFTTRYVSSILFALDVNEPFDSERTFFKKLHMGVEGSVLRDRFKVRLGLSHGYPTFGVGVWSFTYAYYAEEMARHAGQLVDRRHVVAFGL